jgi:hypothetical protein
VIGLPRGCRSTSCSVERAQRHLAERTSKCWRSTAKPTHEREVDRERDSDKDDDHDYDHEVVGSKRGDTDPGSAF